MLNELIKRAAAKAKTVSGPKGLGLIRAVKKWSRIAEEMEEHMMACPSSSQSHSIQSMANKRKLEVSSTLIDLQQRQKRRIDPLTDENINSLDSALLLLMTRHSAGVVIDETILDRILSFSSKHERNDGLSCWFKHIGGMLIEHPFAIDALLHALFFPGVRINAVNVKMKCAKLVAMSVVASEKKIIETLHEEDKSLEWVQQLQNQSMQDIDDITGVSVFIILICTDLFIFL